ncbi:Rv3235 family protein [Glycomyces tarimensis]
MKCPKQNEATAPRISPRQAAGFSCYFLNVLAGRSPAYQVERYATPQGWAAFCRVRRQVPTRLHETRIRRMSCPTERIAEFVVMISDGRTRRAMTLTFRLLSEGWRLDDCAVLDAARPRRARTGA